QTRVYKEKPDPIESLIQCVQTFAEGYRQETIKNVCKNVLKRASFCFQAGGVISSNFCKASDVPLMI
ncbi:Hypothetical protein FKW44_003444, partial [Caligus rogercresseyi]